MKERTYIRKPLKVKAIQYDGSTEMLTELYLNYGGLEVDGLTNIYFTGNYESQLINVYDWLIIENNRVVDVIDRDVFDDMYEQV